MCMKIWKICINKLVHIYDIYVLKLEVDALNFAHEYRAKTQKYGKYSGVYCVSYIPIYRYIRKNHGSKMLTFTRLSHIF